MKLHKIFLTALSLLLFSFAPQKEKPHFVMPYKEAGLTERQAAAHLLSRFTFGARPGDIDTVVKMGLEKWFAQQLEGNLPDEQLNDRLKEYDALQMTNEQVEKIFPRATEIVRMAVKDGIIQKDSIDVNDQKKYREKLTPYMKEKGMRPQRELFRQFASQKVLRATLSSNQLQEVLTDFWFNHFNVSITKRDCAEFIPSYERDVIRPHAIGKFGTLLLATAKSPAMLMYLDNFASAGVNNQFDLSKNEPFKEVVENQMKQQYGDSAVKMMRRLQNNRKNQGLNENYAREVMELHTLGVDGGYTQQDVTQAAKVLTGWTIYPMGTNPQTNAIRRLIETIGEERLTDKGFVHEGDFLFAANRHDASEKKVLDKTFPAGGGYNEGVELLKMLAHHPSTAKFISRKLAIRFVSDDPPQTLIDKMARTFADKDGDIKQVLITMVSSPEFWTKEALRQKTKSPFELAISTVRALNADVMAPYRLYNAIDKMGQKAYFYQAPTGFPDKGQYWINTGSLLNRMNFGLAIATNKLPGVRVNLLALNNNHEPESAEDALVKYCKLIMPERDHEQTIKRLTPLLNDPELRNKIQQASAKANVAPPQLETRNEKPETEDEMSETAMDETPKQRRERNQSIMPDQPATMLSQVVGVIIGSPEFQRR